MTGRRLLLVLLVAWLLAPAAAQDPLDPPERPLRLTASQRQQLREVRNRYKLLRGPIQTQVKAKRLELLQLLAQDQPDKGAVNAKVREINDLQMQINQSVVDELFEIRSILPPEIWKKLRSRMIDEML
ncbi:MAG: hypothetical protein AMXMBFR33_48500 [Candidatus Xenobia bacterium]